MPEMNDFKDNFSKQAGYYSRYRPHYPPELFEYLKELTPQHELAWDCATGNGQSAINLIKFYKKVYATDASAEQLKNALKHKNITYKQETAENCGLQDHSADLVTVAQAIHWFDFEKFYAEVRRVLKPKGIIAAWTYGLPIFSEEINAIIRNFHDNIVGEYWQKENKLVTAEYISLLFPFEKIETPDFYFKKEMNLNDLKGLFGSWSAVQRYKEAKNADPVEIVEKELLQVWKKPEHLKTATWKITLKAGRL